MHWEQNKQEEETVNQNQQIIIDEIKKVISGKDEIIEKVLMAFIAKGHVLMDDIPGVGKTTLVLAFSRTLGLEYKRVQCTPDVIPSDIVGYSMYNKDTGKMEFKPGAVMCNLFLADEINRTSAKTQSALLEVMEEGTVTVDGVTRNVPDRKHGVKELRNKDAGKSDHRRRFYLSGATAVFCDRDAESDWIFRNTVLAGGAVRPVYGAVKNGLSRCGEFNEADEEPADEGPFRGIKTGDRKRRYAPYAERGNGCIYQG